MSGPSTPTFAPFRSGCGLCKPSTDYYNVNRQPGQQGGNGNYSKDSLIPQSNGKNEFKVPDFSVSQEKITKDNLGIEYATAFGGKKKVSKKATKKTKKSVKKPIKKTKSVKKTVKRTKKTRKMRGGQSDSTDMNNDVNSNNSTNDNNSDSVNEEMQGGLKNNLGRDDKSFSSLLYTNTKSSAIIDGGKKKRVVKKKKSTKKSTKKPKKTLKKKLRGGKKKRTVKRSTKRVKKSIKKRTTKKITKKTRKPIKKVHRKKMKGGKESEGATFMDQRFYNKDAPLKSYSSDSGNGIMSAYGPIDAKDIGVGMLAPYTASTSNTANPNTMMKTGGKKKARKSVKKAKKSVKKSKKMRGGAETEGATSLPLKFFNPIISDANYPANSGKGVMSAYGEVQPNDIGQGLLASYTSSNSPTANHNTMMKTGGRKKNLKGGKKQTKKNNKRNNKNNKKNNLKGGKKQNKKNNKKNLKGGKIPNIPDSGVTSVQNKIDDAVNDFSNFLKNLDNDYLKSTEYAKNIKIGSERLIQGGKKKRSVKKSTKKSSTKKSVKKSTKKSSTKKRSIKKPIKKTRSLKKMKKGGFDGSDFASTLNSRGNVAAPNDYWGVPGEKWFRQFNKTGEYIKNSDLPYAATPELAGIGNSNIVSGYNENIINNGNSNYI